MTRHHRLHRARAVHLLLLLGALLSALLARPPMARALPPREDESSAFGPRIERLETAPHELWAKPSRLRAPVWIGLQVGLVLRPAGERAFSGMLLAGIPLERLAAKPSLPAFIHASAGAVAEGAAPQLKPPAGSSKPPGAAPAPPSPPLPPSPPAPAEPEPAPLPIPVRITPDVARAAVGAALRRAHLADPEARVDRLVSRARSSALLPELRLRVSRLVDEAEKLAPTEYDPARTTASGGVSFWFEARATWQLDRALFTEEEIALERLRRDHVEAQARLAARVLELLFAWQRSVALAADASRTPEEHRADLLDVIEAEASLDIVTDGWFTRFRASHR